MFIFSCYSALQSALSAFKKNLKTLLICKLNIYEDRQHAQHDLFSYFISGFSNLSKINLQVGLLYVGYNLGTLNIHNIVQEQKQY